MRIQVILGFIDPRDRERKTARRAVVLGETSRNGRSYLLVAPATSYFARKGVVPSGHVLVQAASPCRKGSGFSSDIDILINVRDAIFISPTSQWLGESKIVGQLNLADDKRVADRFIDELKRFPPREVFVD